MALYEESPIMNYNENNDYMGGALCPPGYELNVVMVVVVIIILLYVLGFFDGLIEDGFYTNLDKIDKYYGGSNI